MKYPDDLRAAIDEEPGHGVADKLEDLFEYEQKLVRELGDSMGYGRLMQAAETVWGEKMKAEGVPGSEHSVGCCVSFLVPCGCTGSSCDWCCGARRITAKTARAKAYFEKHGIDV
jgi:hypothetical protein